MAFIVSRYIQGFKIVFLSVLVFSGMVGLQNCGEPDSPTYECTPDITVLLPEKAVSTFFFEEGTYWVYQREDSLYSDSVWVTLAREEILPVNTKAFPDFKKAKCYESKSTLLSSSKNYFFISNGYILQLRGPKNTLSYSEEVFVLYDGWQKTSQIRLDLIGNEYSTVNAYGDSVYHQDSIEVNGRNYLDITMYKRKSQRPDYLKEAYYAPCFGMIRFKDNNDAWWNLIRYNIVQ